MDFVFGPEVVVGAEMYVKLLKLITVSERTFGDVQHVLGVFVDPEDQRLSGVFDRSAHLFFFSTTEHNDKKKSYVQR